MTFVGVGVAARRSRNVTPRGRRQARYVPGPAKALSLRRAGNNETCWPYERALYLYF